ncbi:reverse transcriptase domain-containing protein [Candidatus Oscillochloris fontis]|uniref:reverse transcriptase domain-containing protein n=1 Tax=Candidatus Oscillochloris fontis TaxID=2496868 RepID=UPI00101C4568|nr:reverse transcriptase domain-containing protein [Candidatus Oscillochloris fontis]
MKTYRNLYPQVYDFENLYHAYRAARRAKRGRAEVARFEARVEDHLFALQTELRDATYQPGVYRHFYISEPKRRKISAAPFRDRVVHHALVNVIEPIYERRFIHDSYACRVGKGTHRALDRCTEFVRKYRFVLQCDVAKFFPTIDHAILLNILGRTLTDPALLRLCERIIQSGAGILDSERAIHWFPGDDLFAPLRPQGLPIGNLTSQFWANVYLNEIDQFIKRDLKCRAYLRYADDFLLFHDDKRTLHTWMRTLQDVTATRLRLLLHPAKCQVFPTSSGVPFLGFRHFASHRRIKRPSVVRFRRRLRGLQQAYAEGQISMEKASASIQSWCAHAAHGNTYRLRKQILRQTIFRPARI